MLFLKLLFTSFTGLSIAMTSLEFSPAPERKPEAYGVNANNNQKRCQQLAKGFFKDGVRRAQERYERYFRSLST